MFEYESKKAWIISFMPVVVLCKSHAVKQEFCAIEGLVVRSKTRISIVLFHK